MHRNYSAVKGKTLQVFLSSTFRDMNAERAIFTKRYAPSLRLLAKSRGLFITFVDLRWGVTVEQATSGAVVSICLERLASSRYFVNFLGLRYGWMPAKEDLTQDTFDRFGHIINSYIPSRSVTEFEVLGGALGWNSKAECAPQSAWFYMRDDAFATLWRKRSGLFTSMPIRKRRRSSLTSRSGYGRGRLRAIGCAARHSRARSCPLSSAVATIYIPKILLRWSTMT
jgi:hypothetical protein